MVQGTFRAAVVAVLSAARLAQSQDEPKPDAKDFCISYYGEFSVHVCGPKNHAEGSNSTVACEGDPWGTVKKGSVLWLCPPDDDDPNYHGAAMTLSLSDGHGEKDIHPTTSEINDIGRQDPPPEEMDAWASWAGHLSDLYIVSNNGSDHTEDLPDDTIQPAVLYRPYPSMHKLNGTEAAFLKNGSGGVVFSCDIKGDEDGCCNDGKDADEECWTGQTVRWNRSTPLHFSIYFDPDSATMDLRSQVQYQNTSDTLVVHGGFNGKRYKPGRSSAKFWQYTGFDRNEIESLYNEDVVMETLLDGFPMFKKTMENGDAQWFSTVNSTWDSSDSAPARAIGGGWMWWSVSAAALAFSVGM